MKTKRPRVAAIGLDDLQVGSITSLCGELRPANSLGNYLENYSLTETDVVVSSALRVGQVDSSVNLMTIGPGSFYWSIHFNNRVTRLVRTDVDNTERELTVPPSCPDLYEPLAAELSRHLGRAAEPPTVMTTFQEGKVTLIETTSGLPVASRHDLPARSRAADGKSLRSIALLLPETSNLAAWFRAFLCDLHESDPRRVPQAPPRLIHPSDWYTPVERSLADRISHIESEIKGLNDERDQLQTKLSAEGERADIGIRRILWADGDDLIDAARDLLTNLGFAVRDMDAELKSDEPKREDFRLTVQCVPEWQAMVEVKGYRSGTKTNDSRQIREHRDRYIAEERRSPNQTVWLSNTFRLMDPSSRPAPDENVKSSAEAIGAVHVLATDLYRQWALVAAGALDKEKLIHSLLNAEPGLWNPPV